ncbi:MAG: murein L,D-transpeptidase catalytic domain-containing protein [Hymenobacter sp.]
MAHGHNSGENEADQLLQHRPEQHEQPGLLRHGPANTRASTATRLRLQGLDEGFNTNAAARSVVMHGADYVSEDFIKQNGRLGRSLGCPALPLDQYSQIIDAVHGGSCLFLNKSNAGYTSKFLNQDIALAALSLKPVTNS